MTDELENYQTEPHWSVIYNTGTEDKVANTRRITDRANLPVHVHRAIDIGRVPAARPEEDENDYALHVKAKTFNGAMSIIKMAIEDPEHWEEVKQGLAEKGRPLDENRLIIMAEDSGEAYAGPWDPEKFDMSGIGADLLGDGAFPGPNFKPAYQASGGIPQYNQRWVDYINTRLAEAGLSIEDLGDIDVAAMEAAGFTDEEIENIDKFHNHSYVASLKLDLDVVRGIWDGEPDKQRAMEAIEQVLEEGIQVESSMLETRILTEALPEGGATVEHFRTTDALIRTYGRDNPMSNYQQRDYSITNSPRASSTLNSLEAQGVVPLEQQVQVNADDIQYDVRLFPQSGGVAAADRYKKVQDRLTQRGVDVQKPNPTEMTRMDWRDWEKQERGMDAVVVIPPIFQGSEEGQFKAKIEDMWMITRLPILQKTTPAFSETMLIAYSPKPDKSKGDFYERDEQGEPILDEPMFKEFVQMYQEFAHTYSTPEPVVVPSMSYKDTKEFMESLPKEPLFYVASNSDTIMNLTRYHREKLGKTRGVDGEGNTETVPDNNYDDIEHINKEGRFTVGVFAGHDLHGETYEKDAAKLGFSLALEDMNVVYGGGSHTVMGQIYEGFVNGARQYAHINDVQEKEDLPKIHGGITQALIASETGGDFPEHLETKYLAPTMSHRKRFLYENSDAFALVWGQIGSLDEVFELMMLKLNNVDVVEGKGLAILDALTPDNGGSTGFQSVLKFMFGEDYKDHKQEIAEKYDVHIVDSQEQMTEKMKEFRGRNAPPSMAKS